ncbi:response regulator transcription factor [Pontibacter sp. G13]|uniref:response regulator transcription factor n=1 Tax=Pontibacter sp. G13 TaxID=3074898 RepID=UPI00288B8264|nr:response regulator transcription factor [Pontibacter sp. G13]WNJ20445.1 response regulator transcription factor [Pontibacter sp. G13]
MPSFSVDKTIRVLVADDSEIYREGIRTIQEFDDSIQIVAEAQDGAEAWSLYNRHDIDVVLMDYRMPTMNGAEAAEKILASDPEAKILVMTAYFETTILRKFVNMGMAGYLNKETRFPELIKAIHHVQDEGHHYGSEVRKIMSPHFNEAESTQIKLTPAEQDVLEWIVCGFSAKQIADKRNTSHYAVRDHWANLKEKFGVPNVASLVREAIRQGFVDPDEDCQEKA